MPPRAAKRILPTCSRSESSFPVVVHCNKQHVDIGLFQLLGSMLSQVYKSRTLLPDGLDTRLQPAHSQRKSRHPPALHLDPARQVKFLRPHLFAMCMRTDILCRYSSRTTIICSHISRQSGLSTAFTRSHIQRPSRHVYHIIARLHMRPRDSSSIALCQGENGLQEHDREKNSAHRAM